MAVEHAQAPGRQRRAARRRETGCGRSRSSARAWRRESPARSAPMSSGVATTPTSTIAADDQRQQRRDGAGDAVGLAALAAREQRGVDRNERRRQRALAEQVLQEVGNPERGRERVGRVVAQAEVVREDALPDQAGDPAAGGCRRRPAPMPPPERPAAERDPLTRASCQSTSSSGRRLAERAARLLHQIRLDELSMSPSSTRLTSPI